MTTLEGAQQTKYRSIMASIITFCVLVFLGFWVYCHYAYTNPEQSTKYQEVLNAYNRMNQRVDRLEDFSRSVKVIIEKSTETTPR
jgi:hypothetical protein